MSEINFDSVDDFIKFIKFIFPEKDIDIATNVKILKNETDNLSVVLEKENG